MLTVLIPTLNSEEPLARMFAPLVGQAVAGLISEVVVYDQGSTDATERVCEISGARFAMAGALDAKTLLKQLRNDWVLILPPGAVLSASWPDMVEAHINGHGKGQLAKFRLAPNLDVPWWQRPFRPLKSPGTFGLGVLFQKKNILPSLKDGAKLESLVRGRAIKTLGAELTPWAD